MTVDNEKTYKEPKKVKVYVIEPQEMWEAMLISYNSNGIVIEAYGDINFVPYGNISFIMEVENE